jgi:hypothetical protein
MFKAKVTVATDVLDAIDDAARQSPKLMQTAFRRATKRLRSRMLADLRKTPGRPHYPLRWKSDKQRRFVMAKLRAEGNLPYQRTGKLEAGWYVEFEPDASGGLFVVGNDAAYARYVVGDDAQPFHLQTGWVQGADVVSDYRVEAEEVLIQTWFTVADGRV